MRLLLCSLAVPWPSRPLLCRFHIDQAKALRAAGVEVEIFSPAPAIPRVLARRIGRLREHAERPEFYSADGVPVHAPRVRACFPPVVRNHLAALCPELVARLFAQGVRPALTDIVRGFRADWILAHGILPWTRVVEQVGSSTGVAHAFIEHSASDWLRIRSGSALDRCYRRAAAGAKAVFAVGPQMVEHASAMGWPGVRFLPNGIVRYPGVVRADATRRATGALRVLTASHWYERKGIRRVMASLSRLAERGVKVALTLVTKPPAEFEAELVEARLRGLSVEILPPMTPRDLRQAMVDSDLFVLPSRDEAFGLVYAEALSVGTPIVLCEDAGFARCLDARAGRTDFGWVLRTGSVSEVVAAVADAAQSREDLRVMGLSGRDRVRRFTWPANASELLGALGACP